MKNKIKICGVTDLEQVYDIAYLGVDYLGFVYDFYDSKRSVDLDFIRRAKRIVSGKDIELVCVSVNKDIDELFDVAKFVDVLQLHGNESVKYCKQLKDKTNKEIWKAFKFENDSEEFIAKLREYKDIVDKIIIDSQNSEEKLMYDDKNFIDYKSLKSLKEEFGDDLIIAGGLNSDNITQVIDFVGPGIFDLSSGVEIEPGVKDIDLVIEIKQKIV